MINLNSASSSFIKENTFLQFEMGMDKTNFPHPPITTISRLQFHHNGRDGGEIDNRQKNQERTTLIG